MYDQKMDREVRLTEHAELYHGDKLETNTDPPNQDSSNYPRGIPLLPNKKHSQTITKSQSGLDFIGHEFGHLLGLIDRYGRYRSDLKTVPKVDDDKFKEDIMGVLGKKATPRAIEEFFRLVGHTQGGKVGGMLGQAKAVPGTLPNGKFLFPEDLEKLPVWGK